MNRRAFIQAVLAGAVAIGATLRVRSRVGFLLHTRCGQPILATTCELRDGDLITSSVVRPLDPAQRQPQDGEIITCPRCGEIHLRDVRWVPA